MMKEYRQLVKQIEKSDKFTIKKNGRKSTIKVVHLESGKLYSAHPGDNAVKPLQHWIKKIKLNNK